eukprot:04914.XXX_137036_139416_1 [CDS] Oithona nana genome sequencing.
MANFTLVPTLPVVVSRLNYSVVSDGDQVEAIYDQGQLSLRRLQQNPFYPIGDVTLEADYSGYRLTQPLKKTPPAAAVLSSTAIKFPIKVDNDKNKCRERYMTMRFCNEAGCSPWSSKITVHHRPSINDRFQMTLVESPPDSVQVYWEMDLDPSFSVYQFDLNVFNTTSQENTLFENIKVLDSGSQENTTQNTINCQRRHFNETLFLPLCSSERELEHIYDISIRASKITRHGTRLEGPWMITLQTSFMCKSPQDALNVPGVLIVSLGSFLSVAVFLAVMYYLFCKAYRIAHLFGEMENEVEETMKWTNSSSSPLILQRP